MIYTFNSQRRKYKTILSIIKEKWVKGNKDTWLKIQLDYIFKNVRKNTSILQLYTMITVIINTNLDL